MGQGSTLKSILFRDEIFPPKMVSLPKLTNCCACISLKTGTLIIGFLNLVGALIFIPIRAIEMGMKMRAPTRLRKPMMSVPVFREMQAQQFVSFGRETILGGKFLKMNQVSHGNHGL